VKLAELHVKEYEKPFVRTLKKRKHNNIHQIKEHKKIDNEFHLVWVTSLSPMSRVGRSPH